MKNIQISSPNNHDGVTFLPIIYGILKNYYEEHGRFVNSYNWLPPIYAKTFTDPEERIDILGISCYTWNTELNFDLAKRVKEKNPSCIVIAGGPNVDHQNRKFFEEHPYIDAIAYQDGEFTFMQVLDKIAEEDYDFKTVPGLLTPRNIMFAPPVKPTTTSAIIDDEFEVICDQIKAVNAMQKIGIILETDRGCPYSCTFCDWGSNTLSKVRKFDIDKVYHDIEWIGKNKVEVLFIANANFGMFPRDVEIAQKIADVKASTGHPKIILTNYTKTNAKHITPIISIFHKAGLIDNFTLSIQTTSEHALKVSERTNLSMKETQKIIDQCREVGLPVRPQLILGMPGETLESFKQSFNDLLALGIYDSYMVFPFELLVNAPANAPAYKALHEIKTKELFVPSYHAKLDGERDKSTYLIETNTFSRQDYAKMFVFTTLVSTLICMGFARLPIVYTAQHGQRWSDIIDGLHTHLLTTELRDTIIQIEELFSNAALTEEMALDTTHPFLNIRIDADELLMIKIYELGFEKAMDQILSYFTNVPADLLRYQKAIMLQPDYDAGDSIDHTFEYDWGAWYDSMKNGKVVDVEKVETKITTCTTTIGNTFVKPIVWHKYPLRLKAFVTQVVVAPPWRSNILFHDK